MTAAALEGRSIDDDILAAADRLIAEVGDAFTTQDLIREAGVALQTFYRYFGGKDQLLLAVIARQVQGYCDAFRSAAADTDDPVARLRTYVTAALEAVRLPGPGPRFITSQHWRLHQSHPAEVSAATKPFADLVAEELVAARDAGLLAPRDPERDAWLITKLVMSAFHHYAFMPDDPGLTTAADDLWAFCLAAVGGHASALVPVGPTDATFRPHDVQGGP